MDNIDTRDYILTHIPTKLLLNKFCEHHYLDSINEGSITLVMHKYSEWNPTDKDCSENYAISEIKNELKKREENGEQGTEYFK